MYFHLIYCSFVSGDFIRVFFMFFCLYFLNIWNTVIHLMFLSATSNICIISSVSVLLIFYVMAHIFLLSMLDNFFIRCQISWIYSPSPSSSLFFITLGISTSVLPSCNVVMWFFLFCIMSFRYQPFVTWCSVFLKYHFIYFVCVFVVSDCWANMVSITQSWLEAEVMSNFQFFKILPDFQFLSGKIHQFLL